MSLRAVDLNLLPTLQALLRERSVSAAGRRLSLSHSAVSEALSRLRHSLNDPLLVRVGRGLELTPRAHGMVAEVEQLCADLSRFFAMTQFDPAVARREFTFAAPDFLAVLLARPMMDALAVRAPGISLHFSGFTDDFVARMASRDLDFALVPDFLLHDLQPTKLRFQPLLTGHTEVLMCGKHPLASRRVISRADLAHYRHISFVPDLLVRYRRRQFMLTGGHAVDVACRVDQLTVVPHLLKGTTLVALVPGHLSEIMAAPFKLRSLPIDFKAADPLLGIAWSPVQDADPAHQWLRELISECVGEPALRARAPAQSSAKSLSRRRPASARPAT